MLFRSAAERAGLRVHADRGDTGAHGVRPDHAQDMAAGAEFRLLGPRSTMLRSAKPVISICAVRTGAGKSPVARHIASLLRERGRRVAVVRHPMPYGNLADQAVQRFASLEDLRTARCMIEEREEYEPHLRQGDLVFAGVDYERILRRAEAEADVIVWDGGNNDFSFYESDLEIVLADPHRAGDERGYFPGEVNLLRADVVILTKTETADSQKVAALRATIRSANPTAVVIDSTMPVTVEDPSLIRGKRVLVIEDGPTVTHGGMAYGAGTLAAKQYGAAAMVDPRPAAVGSLRDTFRSNPHLTAVLPAMGYGAEQIRELEQTINAVDCDLVLIATPVDLRRLISLTHPACAVSYAFEEPGGRLRSLRQVSAGRAAALLARGIGGCPPISHQPEGYLEPPPRGFGGEDLRPMSRLLAAKLGQVERLSMGRGHGWGVQ